MSSSYSGFIIVIKCLEIQRSRKQLCHSNHENVVLIACTMILTGLILSSLMTKQALQWWYRRQSIQLGCEADKIRNTLLQESFTIRRTLELSLADSLPIPDRLGQDLLDKIEEFHYSLDRLVDRLSPPYSEDSLPLAIQYIIESWRTSCSWLNVDLELPIQWRYEPPERSQIVLMALNELLRIIGAESLSKFSIHVSLELQGEFAELRVKFDGIDRPIVISDRGLKDLEYLRESFQFLTTGECSYHDQDLANIWYFRWASQVD